MATGKSREPRFTTSVSSVIDLHVGGNTFHLNKKSVMWRSGRLSKLVKDKSMRGQQQFMTTTYCCLPDIPGDAKTIKLAIDFCDGREPELNPSNVIPLACIASYLEMSEEQSPNNLLNLCLSFLHRQVLPHWNSSLQALRSCELRGVLPQALTLGLVDSCVDSIAAQAAADRFLLNPTCKQPLHVAARAQGPSARRVLFPGCSHPPLTAAASGCDQEAEVKEDLIHLSLPLFELAISAVFRLGVASDQASNCIFRYALKHPRKEVMEAVERLLPSPDHKDASGGSAALQLVPNCKMLSELLRCAIQVQANQECRRGLEGRMSFQLHEAGVEDLLIPCHGYSKETQYDVACVIRMLKDFYGNYSLPDSSGLVHVMELVTSYLSHVAGDPHLRKEMFVSLVGMVAFTLEELESCTDSVYSAIDVYLSAQGHLTESEKEQVCQMLNVHRMSSSALGHAARNERLPLRLVVQVLFVCQFRLQEAIVEGLPPDPKHADYSARKEEAEVAEGPRRGKGAVPTDTMAAGGRLPSGRDMMDVGMGGKATNLWKDLKRKFGCKSDDFHKANEAEYHRVKKHPRK